MTSANMPGAIMTEPDQSRSPGVAPCGDGAQRLIRVSLLHAPDSIFDAQVRPPLTKATHPIGYPGQGDAPPDGQCLVNRLCRSLY